MNIKQHGSAEQHIKPEHPQLNNQLQNRINKQNN